MPSPRATRSANDDAPVETKKNALDAPPVKRLRVVLVPENQGELLTIRLPHPKNGCPSVFVVDSLTAVGRLSELLACGSEHRAWFMPDAAHVEKDGRLLVANRCHPAFVLLPMVRASVRGFREIDELVNVTTEEGEEGLNEGLRCLIRSPSIGQWMAKIADCKELDDTTVYRYNEEKTLAFLTAKFDLLSELLREEENGQHVNRAIVDNDEAYRRYVFGIVSDYLDDETTDLLREHVHIAEMKIVAESPIAKKSRSNGNPTEDYSAKENNGAKAKPKLSKKQMDLQTASKGTKALSSFFTRKAK